METLAPLSPDDSEEMLKLAVGGHVFSSVPRLHLLSLYYIRRYAYNRALGA